MATTKETTSRVKVPRKEVETNCVRIVQEPDGSKVRWMKANGRWVRCDSTVSDSAA